MPKLTECFTPNELHALHEVLRRHGKPVASFDGGSRGYALDFKPVMMAKPVDYDIAGLYERVEREARPA